MTETSSSDKVQMGCPLGVKKSKRDECGRGSCGQGAATASPDKWAGRCVCGTDCSRDDCHVNNDGHHIRQTAELAEWTVMRYAMMRRDMCVVLDVVRTVLTILLGIPLHCLVMVEGDCKCHGQIHEYQQPRYPSCPVVKCVHPGVLFFLCKVMAFLVMRVACRGNACAF